MKVTVNIDCTPEEARAFFGLPDVKPLQQAWMAEMEKRMKDGLTASDMESLIKAWTPPGMGGMEQFQKMFWNAFSGASGGAASGEGGKAKGK